MACESICANTSGAEKQPNARLGFHIRSSHVDWHADMTATLVIFNKVGPLDGSYIGTPMSESQA